ncbi:helicase HerA domain-containing protein [Streptomyces sp. NPDC086033]|uniref:helicase HerA domain-containing protein n=1 Tax=Streptomyces sp. NPDC086033 TaxID=3365747 RepID=UPI0037CEA789
MVDLIPHVGAGTLLESVLLADDRAVRVGAIQALDFGRAIVITHDRWKAETGGIPQFSFLLATAREIGTGGGDDDEVLLLRVEGTAPLSLERDLLGVREEALRDALSRHESPSPSVVLDLDIDPFTRNRISFTGLDCRIIGTFYEQSRDGKLVLDFGHDVDNFYATATYRVYKPVGPGLSAIASYIKPGGDEKVENVRIGAVRYSSTRRRAMASGQDDAPVFVNVYDFIGNKTGMFGMTRMGKSNTMKTVISRVFAVSENRRAQGKAPIGQLIFDPQGEYANPNSQDGTHLAALGERHVIIYKFGAAGDKPNVRPLGFNFFDPAQVDAVKGVISSALVDAAADYVRAFVQADFEGSPIAGETSGEAAERKAHATRGRLVLYGALSKADFPVPMKEPEGKWPWRAWVTMRKELVDELENQLGPGHLIRAKSGRQVGVERTSLTTVLDWLIERAEANDLSGKAAEGLKSIVEGDAWRSALPIYTQENQGRQVSGYTKLKPLQSFHTPSSRSDYRSEVYGELVAGRVVIVDLHLGPDKVVRKLSDNLASYVMQKQTEVFTSGDTPPKIQVVIEEAHNLFSVAKYKDELDVWVRLAKEASKLKIGMIYATQEVTGVAHQVLANTKNWVVAHLNNTREVNELARFYDFKAFSDSIISHEDKGYVRLKTMSSPFIIPVHIDKYGRALVNEGRAAAGDPPLPEEGERSAV